MEQDEVAMEMQNESAENVGLETLALESTDAVVPLICSTPRRQTQRPVLEERKPRLIITQMLLHDFKSYAGTQVIGPFHRSFSAIVGPNGSGKSNVIDALLFVFGYRANKIRQGKLSELIHSSKNGGNPHQCSVEVHFREIIDSEDGKTSEDIPGSELVVSRIATKSNQSKYLLNGIQSTYTEVTNLLRKKGIDLDHKRFLILQGEVENISQMKPKGQTESEVGLLEYLEDIIGTAMYKGQIEEARKRVDEFNGLRSERLQRVKIVEREKDSLEGRKNEAVEFVKAENALTRKKAILFQKRLHDCKAKFDKTKAKFDKVLAELNAEQQRQAEFRSQTKSLEESRDQTTKECEVLELKAKEVADELSKFEREEVQLQVNRKHVTGKLKKFKESGTKESHSINSLKNTLSTLEHDMENGRVELADLEQRLVVARAELEQISDGLRGKTDQFTAQIEEKQKELAPWKQKISAHQSKLEIAQTELNVLNDKFNVSGKHLEQAKHELRRLREMRIGKARFAESKVEELAVLGEQLEESDRGIQKSEGRFQVLRDTLSDARRKEEEAKTALSATESQGKVLKAILQQRDNGSISGIYGRLGSLGTISEKYDVAISSSCGGGLDNIVVQTVRAGQQCVEYLRKHNVGRARFVILETLRQFNLNPIQTPENAPRLFDLVKSSDPKFLPAFYHAMSDTLVAKDMDQARRIAYGRRRHRVVTLDGNVLETSGTMSGGGNRVARGAMSSKPIQGDVTMHGVAKLTAARESAELDYNEHHAALRKAQEKHTKLQRQYDDLESLLPRLEIELKSVDDQVQMAKKRARDLQEAQGKPGEADMALKAKIDAKIEKEQRSMAELHEQCATIEADIKELQEKIMQAGGIRLRTQKAKVDGLQDRIKTCNDEVSRWQVSHAKSTKELQRVERANAGRDDQVADLENQLAKVTKDIEEKSMAAIEVKERCEQARVLLETKREELEKVKEELDSKMEEYNEMRTKEASMKRKADDAERLVAESTRAVSHWSSALENLALHPINLDEIESVDRDEEQPKALPDNVEHADYEVEDMDVDDEEEGQEKDASQTRSADAGLPQLSPEELEDIDADALETQIEQGEAKLQRTRPNLSVLTEYVRRAREFKKRMGELDQITQQRDGAQKQMDDLRTRRLEEFMTGFNVISYKLKEMYQMITLGGNAELELVDSLDPFSEGLVFSVMPPKKSWKNISHLSGGEKTLSSLALVFALHQYKPTPLYVMDEIDAALDFRNVSIVANYIKERTRDAQFVIISLRNNMFELADRLVGIYKTDNRTKSIALDTEHTAGTLHSTTSPTEPAVSTPVK